MLCSDEAQPLFLRLGKAQNTDFYGQVADASLALITYTILALYKRFESYETLGALFRSAGTELIEKTLCERIALVFLKIVTQLLELLCIDVEQSISRIISANGTDKNVIIMLNAVNQLISITENDRM
jgi:sulfite exporter TauE/SafE